MEFPVKPGPLTLVYPKWIPGEHSPTEAIVDATGLHFRGGGKEIAWRRDDVDLYAFRCTIPAGVTTLEVTLDYLLPAEPGTAGVPSASARVAGVPWNVGGLYPHDARSPSLEFAARIRVSGGWRFSPRRRLL